MLVNIERIKFEVIALPMVFALLFSFTIPTISIAKEVATAEELKEKYRLMYEKMKKSQNSKGKDTALEGSSEKDKKTADKKRIDKKKQRRLEIVRKREEARLKAKQAWFDKFSENTKKLVSVESVPDLTKSPKGFEGMTYIPKGKFLRGQDWGEWADNQPSQVIYLSSYYIDTYEVTVKNYKAYLKENKKSIPFYLKRDEMAGDDMPIFKVSWQNAIDYCIFYDKRLPTEAEWAKAARGWDSRYYPWGNALPDEGGEFRANYAPETRAMDGALYTIEVGSYPNGVSPYGVHDMSGNIAEWTADWFDADYYKVKVGKNPKGPELGTQKVVRGGGYDVSYNNLLLTTRIAAGLKVKNNFIGFRCAVDVK